MPNKKKKNKGAAKSKKKEAPVPKRESNEERAQKIEARSSIEIAEELERRFQTPSKLLDQDAAYAATKSAKRLRKEETAYRKVSAQFNAGLECTNSATNTPHLSRWHLVQDKMMNAIDAALTAEEAFLTTTGTDRRNLLCKCCLTIAQCRGKALDAKGQLAWAKAAVAADPTYFNAHNWLSIGYMNCKMYQESLDSAKTTMSLEGWQASSSVTERRTALEKVVNGDDKESYEAEREIVLEGRGAAVRWWQEMSMDKPVRTCAFCFRPGDSKCAQCQVVYYCSRACQKYDFKEHKQGCVAPSEVRAPEYPKPDYPSSELCSDEVWNFFKKQGTNESMLMVVSNSCHLGAVKRALVEGDDVNVLGSLKEYPVHVAALRREPENAVEIMKVLIKHGACLNVMRPDGKHLLAICRERARWIDDLEPSGDNQFFQLRHRIDGSLEDVERQESQELVGIVSDAVQKHKLCRLCKARKQLGFGDSLSQMRNMTDELHKSLGGYHAR